MFFLLLPTTFSIMNRLQSMIISFHLHHLLGLPPLAQHHLLAFYPHCLFSNISLILSNIIGFLITSIIWFVLIIMSLFMRYVSSHHSIHRLHLPRGDVNHLPSQHQLISSTSPIASTTALLLLSINFIITFRLLSIFFLFFFIIYLSFFSWSAFDAFHVLKTFLKLQHNLLTLHDQYLLPFSFSFFYHLSKFSYSLSFYTFSAQIISSF